MIKHDRAYKPTSLIPLEKWRKWRRTESSNHIFFCPAVWSFYLMWWYCAV